MEPLDERTSSPAVLAASLERALADELPALRAIADGPETAAPNRPTGVGWSRREEIGHLIDSAVNNHARFVRAALEPELVGPTYDQEGWVEVHRYREIPWPRLVDLWEAHNRILVPLIAGLPARALSRPCTIGGGQPVTLGFLIDDYVLHMRHHLDNVLRREPPTKYPRDA